MEEMIAIKSRISSGTFEILEKSLPFKAAMQSAEDPEAGELVDLFDGL